MANRRQRVAVVGAGISGVGSAVHLHSEGLDVTVFERSSSAGGVWVFDERTPPEPKFPTTVPSTSDLSFYPTVTPEELQDEEILRLTHAPPGPCYKSLKNNISTVLLKLQNQPWKPGTEDVEPHHVLAEYIQEIPKREHIESLFRYDTRVVNISKHDKIWKLESETLVRDESGKLTKEKRIEDFDGIVVASGHYHSSKIPDIPGLEDLKASFPSKIIHSKSYRVPDSYKNQKVLLVGAGVSANDIAKDLHSVAAEIIQVSRDGAFDLPAKGLPEGARRVGAIKAFVPKAKDDGTLPITVQLQDGTEVESIHRIIFCTGYFMTYPFLPQFHNDGLKPEDADEEVLVTDGLQTHNLHKDIFYMKDPSLAFVGVPYNIATFSFFEFQAMLVAAVFAGKAKMPSEREMREEYAARVKELGGGRGFHSRHDRQKEYVDSLVEWVNKDGGNMQGHTPDWVAAYEVQMKKLRDSFGELGRERRPPPVKEKDVGTKENDKGWLKWVWSLVTWSN